MWYLQHIPFLVFNFLFVLTILFNVSFTNPVLLQKCWQNNLYWYICCDCLFLKYRNKFEFCKFNDQKRPKQPAIKLTQFLKLNMILIIFVEIVIHHLLRLIQLIKGLASVSEHRVDLSSMFYYIIRMWFIWIIVLSCKSSICGSKKLFHSIGPRVKADSPCSNILIGPSSKQSLFL